MAATLLGCWVKQDPRLDDSRLIASLDSEVRALQERIQIAEDSAAACDDSKQPEAIYAELVQVLSTTEAKVSRLGRTTIVEIPHSLVFNGRSRRVRAEARMVLDMVATAAKLHTRTMLTIVGHTDSSPTRSSAYPTNWELSAVRASAIARYLVKEFAMPSHRLTVAGRGQVEPLTENDTPAGAAKNRRYEIVIAPALHKEEPEP
jgi:chemotaxis protein MotB